MLYLKFLPPLKDLGQTIINSWFVVMIAGLQLVSKGLNSLDLLSLTGNSAVKVLVFLEE